MPTQHPDERTARIKCEYCGSLSFSIEKIFTQELNIDNKYDYLSIRCIQCDRYYYNKSERPETIDVDLIEVVNKKIGNSNANTEA